MVAPLILSLLSLFSVIMAQKQATITAQADKGTIVAPAAGAKIKPNQTFPFRYELHRDYCMTSQNFTVTLLTKPPMSTSNTGHYFGRFATGGYGRYPDPDPPMPTEFTMPDFSLRPGGWGVGLAASNVPVWITVTEEWNYCTPTFGNNWHVTSVQAVYNATS